jgi:hypothetical protein
MNELKFAISQIQAAPMTTKIVLKLRNDALDKIFFEALTDAITSFHQFISIEFRRCTVNTDDLITFIKQLPSSGVEKLVIDHCNIPSIVAKHIAAVLPFSLIKILILAGNCILDEGLIAIANVLTDSRLAALDVDMNQIGPKGVTAIANTLATGKTSLLHLWMNNNNQIKEESAFHFADVLPKTGLQSIGFLNTAIGMNGVRALCCAVVETPSILTVALGYNMPASCNEMMIEDVNSMLKGSRVQRLILNTTSLNNSNVALLAEGFRASNYLTWFSMSFNPLVSNIDPLLAAAATHRTLKEVILTGTAVSDKDKTKMEELIKRLHSEKSKVMTTMCHIMYYRAMITVMQPECKLMMLPDHLLRHVGTML